MIYPAPGQRALIWPATIHGDGFAVDVVMGTCWCGLTRMYGPASDAVPVDRLQRRARDWFADHQARHSWWQRILRRRRLPEYQW
jgi:hypothetical protein